MGWRIKLSHWRTGRWYFKFIIWYSDYPLLVKDLLWVVRQSLEQFFDLFLVKIVFWPCYTRVGQKCHTTYSKDERREGKTARTKSGSLGPQVSGSPLWHEYTLPCLNILCMCWDCIKRAMLLKIVATKLCGYPFSLRPWMRALDHVRLVLCNEPAGMGL